MIRAYRLWVCTVFAVVCCACSGEPVLPPPSPPPAPPEPELPQWGGQETDAFSPAKGVALLDLTARNGEKEDGATDGRNLYSAGYMLEVAGVPCFTTGDFGRALSESCMVLLSSQVKDATFTDEELAQLAQWVAEGGTVVAPACTASGGRAAELFGISSASYNKQRFFISWDDRKLGERELEYMDEPEEKDISLGSKAEGESVKTWGYTLAGAERLAQFDTGEPAVVRNLYGAGRVYSFGVLWRDMIQRPQLNKDFMAQRSYSNDFEPSADAFPLFVRSVYAGSTGGVVVWKSTVPDGFRTVLIPTHDCDSRTAYDEMHYMSEYEREIGVSGQYFLTTHYYRDAGYLSAFYDDASILASRKLVADGHTVGSHSIGHFPDFNRTERFPIEKADKEHYRPHHNPETGITEGGSTWAEIALSKEILEKDLGNRVRSLRTGHLAMNKNIPAVCEDAGYSFSSCYAAGDVLTCFPYFERIGNEWPGRQSAVLQMPLHFSDVITGDPMDENNWQNVPAMWRRVMGKLAGNYAPSILLIHPNREWKMLAEKMLVERLDRTDVGLWNLEDYGDFWVARSGLRFAFAPVEGKNKVMIRAERADFDKNPHLCFMVETSADASAPEVVLLDENSNSRPLRVKRMAAGKFMAY